MHQFQCSTMYYLGNFGVIITKVFLIFLFLFSKIIVYVN